MDTRTFAEAVGKTSLPFVCSGERLNDEKCQKLLKKIKPDANVLALFVDDSGFGVEGFAVQESGIKYAMVSASTGDMKFPKMKGEFPFDKFCVQEVAVKKGIGIFNVAMRMWNIDKRDSFDFQFKFGCYNFSDDAANDSTAKEFANLLSTLTEKIETTDTAPGTANNIPGADETLTNNTARKPAQENSAARSTPNASARPQGKGLVVYKDWKMIVMATIAIIAAPIFGVYSGIHDGNFGSGNHILWLLICCLASVAGCYYHKYLRSGIIIDLNARVISFPKVVLFAFFKHWPRNDISFDDITEIQAVNKVQTEGNSSATLKFIMTYKFVILGTFGSKTVSFRDREKRDQFYSLLRTYGNFS